MRHCAILAGLVIAGSIAAIAGGQRILFSPKFSVGENLRYQIDSRATTTGKTTSPITDPEGGSKSNQSVNVVVLLTVLDVQPISQGAPVKIHFEATFEKSSAHSESDVFDPNASSLEDRYARLKGRSLEFTLDPGGPLADFKGPQDVLAVTAGADSALSPLNSLSSGSGLPSRGIAIGEKWSNERALGGLPLAGVVWHADSTYLRDEPCHSSFLQPATAAAAPPSEDTCAVILTRFAISRRGRTRSDATPDDYRRSGLQTSGSLSGSGESLDAISIASGLLVSSTQTSTQDMDYQIVSTSAHTSIHHVGHVQTQLQIALLSQAPPSR